jgi:hypothetical protein
MDKYRYAMTAALEDAKEIRVDQWGTLNTAASPQKLPAGHSPNNQNVWMDEKPGSVVTANGYTRIGAIPSGNPPTFGIDFFRTSDGTSKFVVSDGETVWWTIDYVNYTQIITGLSPFFQLRGAVIRDKLWLTNGSDPVMTWNGTTLTVMDGSGGSSPNVPKGKYIAYHDERVFLYGIDGDLSSLRFSSLADSSGTEIAPDGVNAWPIDNELQISEGDADVGTGLWLYRGYLYCSKQNSIWRIVGYDEYTYTRVKTRASTGTRFQESVQIKDNLVHFIGVDGMYVFDGEEALRISDIIDPASPDQGVFAFRNLQQPLLNNQFWNVSETTDFDAGTKTPNLSTAGGQLQLSPVDDSAADFGAGSNSDTSTSLNPGNVQLDFQASGGSSTNVAPGQTPGLTGGVSGSVIESAACGYIQNVDGAVDIWQVLFNQTFRVGKVTIGSFYFERANAGLTAISSKLQYTTDGTNWSDVPGGTVTLPASTVIPAQAYRYYPFDPGGSRNFVNDTTIEVTFPTISCTGIRYFAQINRGNVVIKELYIYRAPYELTGTFTSKSLDFGVVPASFGSLAALVTTNGETYQFFTQSSSDNSTWDAAVNVANGSAIGSTLRRYLRWGVTLNSSTGLNTPVVDKVYVGALYTSAIHNTGGNIFQWAAFQMTRDLAGGAVSAYYRAASTELGVSAQGWTAIVPGAVPGAAITDTFIQIKLEISTVSATAQPSVQSFTVNWIISSGAGTNTLQNVASVTWLNRYWLTAATIGSESNDIIVVSGKITKLPDGSNAPPKWHKKDFQILMFCKFQNILIGGSSTDGTLYRMEYGYSKDGAAMDSFYETADFSKESFMLKGRDLLVTADRTGPYNLSVGWSSDGGSIWTEKLMDLTRATGQSLSQTKRFNINFMSDYVRFRVRINAADQPFSVDELLVFYRLSPQRGSLN